MQFLLPLKGRKTMTGNHQDTLLLPDDEKLGRRYKMGLSVF